MGQKKALMTASVASMIDLFNMDNIHILQELGYEVHVAANFEFGSITSQERVDEFRRQLEREGIVSYHVPIPRSIGDVRHIAASYRQMKRLIQKEQYKIIHTQSPIGGAVARLAAKKSRKDGYKVIYTAHGFHFYDGAPKKNWLLFYPVEKYLSRYTDVLITINQEDYGRAKTFHAKRVFHMPGIGIDVEKFARQRADREVVRQRFGVLPEDYLLVSVGQLSVRKNQETAIRALGHIPDSHVKYLLAGFGEREETDRALARTLHLEQRVIFAGYQSDMGKLLHAADCFVFPSIQEGLPVALMEAMAAGLPVVCSRIRGNTDLVADGAEGRLVDPMDAAGYAEAVMELRQDPERARAYASRAREKVKAFGRGNVHKKMEEIYRDAGSEQVEPKRE